MFKHRVLITSVSGSFGPQNINFMKKSIQGEVWVLGVDVQYNHVSEQNADKFVLVPKGNSDEYIKKICELIELYNISLILPCSDEEAISLSKNRKIIERNNTVLATAATSTIEIISSKILTYSFFKKLGIAITDFEVSNNKKDLYKHALAFYKERGSFVIKDAFARGNRGTILVDKLIKGKKDYMGSRELHIGWEYFNERFTELIDDNFPKLITERLYEPAYDIDILAKQGKVIHAISRERINPAGVPYHGNIMRNNIKLLNIARKVSEALKLTWLYDIDIMTRKDGTPVVLEVNPRPSGSSVASMECGVPLYRDLLQLSNLDPFNTEEYFQDGTIIIPSLQCNVIKP
ncbi:ATP-grasp domain-containing protein [Alphaproteobacteria bacterium]|nr:ATP-grasp domain-containing protein [Alphaproteobacteria bacterium]